MSSGLLFVVWFLSGIGMGGSPRCLLDVPLGIQPFFILAIRCIVASGIFRVSLYMPADVIGDFLVNFFALQLDYEEVVARS